MFKRQFLFDYKVGKAHQAKRFLYVCILIQNVGETCRNLFITRCEDKRNFKFICVCYNMKGAERMAQRLVYEGAVDRIVSLKMT